MHLKHFLLLAALGLAACGGASSPDQNTAEGSDTAAAIPSDEPSTDVAPAEAGASAPAANAEEGEAPASERFQLGKDYVRLTPTQPTSSGPDQVEVAEVFWYGCPHCNDFEPYLRKWEMTKPDYVNFVRIPAVRNPLMRMHARMYYTAQALGKGEEMHEAFFREIQVNGDMLDSEEKIAAFFTQYGVGADDFMKTWDSFAVDAKLQRADELARRYNISSVPTVVINGKYVSDDSMAGSYDRLIELIDDLVGAEHAGH